MGAPILVAALLLAPGSEAHEPDGRDIGTQRGGPRDVGAQDVGAQDVGAQDVGARDGGARDGGDSDRPYLAAALDAARWLESVAVSPTEAAESLAWPADPARDATPSWNLYAGTPGVVVFFLELAAATGDERWMTTAKRGADALLDWCWKELPKSAGGLYTGSAGVGFALTETWLATGDERYREGALVVLARLHAGAQREGHGVRWSSVTDVIAGDAGIGFFLLYAADRLERSDDLGLATAAGFSLLARGDEVSYGEGDSGIDWPMSPEFERRMPNFSHGTAGVATFLAALYGETQEGLFLEAAEKGARHLNEIADRTGGGFRVHHHTPDGGQLFYLGWCHGPAGTARLFRTLARVTGEEKWLELERDTARALLGAGLPDARPDGYWNNVGPCCGAAGVASAMLDAHARLELEGSLALSRILTVDVVTRATVTDAGLSWEHAEHRARPDYLSTQTGYQQGAAGIGLWLLHFDAFEEGRQPVVRMPEDRF